MDRGSHPKLGIEICHRTEDLIKLNYTKALAKMKNVLQIWDKRYLTLYGQIIMLNSFVISQFVYLMSVLPSPSNEMIIDIEKMLFIYGKPDKIKREFMKMPKAMGGMSVPDISLKNLALKIAWVQRIINNDNKWNTL